MKTFVYHLTTLILTVWQLGLTDGLDCYSCSNLRNISGCHQLAQCNADEICYTQTTGYGDQTRYILGCRSMQACISPPTSTLPSLNIVGRDVANYVDCNECCAIDTCNKRLCNGNTNPMNIEGCLDDPEFNCQQVASIFNLCSDVHHAKLKCRKFCGLCTLVDGMWSGWQSWSSCDSTCGNGTKSRTRVCDKQVPKDGGLPCPGFNHETNVCVLGKCPDGNWVAWSSWGHCSVTCGVGLERRGRTCSNPHPGPYGDQCLGYAIDDRTCFYKACTDGSWSSWSNWGSSCVGRLFMRNRTCNNPSPSQFGKYCAGKSEDSKACICPVSQASCCHKWSQWSVCYSRYVYKTRTRDCPGHDEFQKLSCELWG